MYISFNTKKIYKIGKQNYNWNQIPFIPKSRLFSSYKPIKKERLEAKEKEKEYVDEKQIVKNYIYELRIKNFSKFIYLNIFF